MNSFFGGPVFPFSMANILEHVKKNQDITLELLHEEDHLQLVIDTLCKLGVNADLYPIEVFKNIMQMHSFFLGALISLLHYLD